MDARLRQGVGLFNDGKFFEAHEALESFYQDTEEENKAFLEGLIGLAAAFRLYCDFAETRGPVRMIYQSLIRLENYQPAFLQIDVRALCESAEAWAKKMESGGDPRPSPDIPKIRTQRFRFFS